MSCEYDDFLYEEWTYLGVSGRLDLLQETSCHLAEKLRSERRLTKKGHTTHTNMETWIVQQFSKQDTGLLTGQTYQTLGLVIWIRHQVAIFTHYGRQTRATLVDREPFATDKKSVSVDIYFSSVKLPTRQDEPRSQPV